MKVKESIMGTAAAIAQETAKIADMAKTSNDECLRMSARIQELETALRWTRELIGIARPYFPKSIKHHDRFQLELTCATINNALDKEG